MQKTAMWASFWANCMSKSMARASFESKLRLLNRACTPSLRYKCARWPPQRTVAKRLDGLQSRMISMIIRLPPADGESPADFVARRNRVAARIGSRYGKWSSVWYGAAISWHKHLLRGHDHYSWPVLLLRHHDAMWLEARRALGTQGRPATRRQSGGICKRWEEAIAWVENGCP